MSWTTDDKWKAVIVALLEMQTHVFNVLASLDLTDEQKEDVFQANAGVLKAWANIPDDERHDYGRGEDE